MSRLKTPGRAGAGLVKISYGVHHLEMAMAGKSVGEVRQALKEPLNVEDLWGEGQGYQLSAIS